MNYVEQIQRQTEQVIGSKEKASGWLNQPKTALGDQTPIELAHSEAGHLLVKNVLKRINS